MVGHSLVPMLATSGWQVKAFSRQAQASELVGTVDMPVDFRKLPMTAPDGESIPYWVCLAPIWVLPEYFNMLATCQARRVIALSSTSIYTKQNSPDTAEQHTAGRLRKGEQGFIAWAEANRIEWVILRPTLIYGLGRDRNIGEIARFIARFGFFPLLGAAQGMRQPVHAEDVARACMAALQNPQAANHAYNISGAERLPYREMVKRIFWVMGKPERYVRLPIFVFRAAINCLRVLPRFRSWSVGMADRMNSDMIFDHAEAKRDLGFSPRPFHLTEKDFPASVIRHST